MVNAGIYCIDRSFLEDALGSLKNDNAQQEWYLTDIVEIGFKNQKAVSAVVCEDAGELMGVNSQEDLRQAEERMRLMIAKKS